jgi:hypothetical protein
MTPEQIAELHKQQSEMNAVNQQRANRPPEVYIKDGESRTLRFLTGVPMAAFMEYSLPIGGGRFATFSQPPPGEVDLFEEAGMRPSLRTLYEVIDITGYTDREGKTRNMLHAIFKVSKTLHEQIQMVAEELQSSQGVSLSQVDIKVRRAGQGKQTAYTLMPLGKIKRDLSKYVSLRAKLAQYYAPPTETVQRTYLSKAQHGGE